jgi:sortase (surface protein transpeptidase)
MFTHRPRGKPVLALDLLMVGLVVAGITGLAFGRPSGPATARMSGSLSVRQPPSTARASRGHDEPRPVRPPKRVAIPAVGVAARVVRLGLNLDGTLEVPTDYSVAGWYRLGPKPGETGAAVIVGHVDSTAGPAVFYRLGEVVPGDLVRVASGNRPVLRFRIYAVREYSKAAFPTARVYGQTTTPELRLITCGGPFDDATGHYLDNVVVFARLVAPGGVEPPHADSKSAALVR